MASNTVPDFWAKVDMVPDGCWLWTGKPNTGGYGRFSIFKTRYPAHRLSLILASGRDPSDLFACHHCDVRLCVNPKHLYWGDHDDNMKDMANRGRRKGMRNKSLEYIPAQVFSATLKEIKARKGLTWREMGVITGRSPGTLSAFAHGKREFVLRNTADDVIRRLSGEPLPPTARQTAEYTVKARKTQSEQRTETLQSRKLGERKAAVAELRAKLGQICLD